MLLLLFVNSLVLLLWSEHCRLYHDNIPITWDTLKNVTRTRCVPPYYQRELLQKLQHLRQGKNSIEEYYQELQTGMIRCGIVDEDINTIVTPTAPTATYTGPITRDRARQLNYQVLSFLGNDSNVHENMMLPKLDTFVLLTNEGPSFDKDEHWIKNKHGDDGMRKGNKNGATSDDFRTLKPP